MFLNGRVHFDGIRSTIHLFFLSNDHGCPGNSLHNTGTICLSWGRKNIFWPVVVQYEVLCISLQQLILKICSGINQKLDMN